MAQVQFRFDFSDYVHARKLHRRGWEGLDLLLPICGAITLAAGFAILRSHSFDGAGLLEFVFSAILITFPLLARLSWRYSYRRTRSEDCERKFEFTEDLIRTQTANSRGEIEWSAIRSFAEDKNMFLLYLAPAKFFPIPKRACTAGQIDELRALFQQNIKTQ